MKKVFEDFDITLVGHIQSLLESSGVATYIKNRFGTSGAGELPFIEVIPQLWVLNDADVERAKALIDDLLQQADKNTSQSWNCPQCETPLEAVFTHCWKCSAERPELAGGTAK